MAKFHTDKRGRVWMLWKEAGTPNPNTLSNLGRGLPRDRHIGPEELLDSHLGLPFFMGRVVADIRMRTARSLLERSGDGRAFVMDHKGELSLMFVSDTVCDDHHLARLLRPEIGRLLEGDEYRGLFQYV